MAWLLPEPDVGLEPELKPLAPFELELEPVELEPVEPEPDEVQPDELEPDEEEPDEPELEDEPEFVELPVEDEPDDTEEDEPVWWVEPGRARATAPAATTLAMVTAVVVERTLAWPRSLAATAL